MSVNENLFFAKKSVLKQKPKLMYIGRIATEKEMFFGDRHIGLFPEFLYVKRGRGTINVCGHILEVNTNDLVVFNKEVEHFEDFSDSQDRELVFMGVNNIMLAGLAPDNVLMDKPYIVIHGEDHDFLSVYFDQIFSETKLRMPFGKAICDDLVRIVLMLVLRMASHDTNITFNKNMTFFGAKEYFDQNFLAIENLDTVCETLNINKFYLTHIFKKQIGIPPIKYLIIKRMDFAKTILTTTSKPVSEVAKDCKYNDTAYFCRVFKRTVGVTPMQYRHQFKRKL